VGGVGVDSQNDANYKGFRVMVCGKTQKFSWGASPPRPPANA